MDLLLTVISHSTSLTASVTSPSPCSGGRERALQGGPPERASADTPTHRSGRRGERGARRRRRRRRRRPRQTVCHHSDGAGHILHRRPGGTELTDRSVRGAARGGGGATCCGKGVGLGQLGVGSGGGAVVVPPGGLNVVDCGTGSMLSSVQTAGCR